MVDTFQAIILALVQGITEFLPISSSAHLILTPKLWNWPDQGTAFDTVIHAGTLTAVLIYFRQDLRKMTFDWCNATLKRQSPTAESRLAWAVLLGTIPVGIVGFVGKDFIATYLRSPIVIAWSTILFGLLLGYASLKGRKARSINQLHWKDIAIVGVAQAFALIPGTSRSGITMTAALGMGLDQDAAARYSFLLAIPVIVLAGGLQLLSLIKSPESVNWTSLGISFIISAICAFYCIHWFLKLIAKIGFAPFVAYRILLGIGLLWVFY